MINDLMDTNNLGPSMVPLERAGNINDMGGLILYLASLAGSYANGTVFVTDGGRLGLFPSAY